MPYKFALDRTDFSDLASGRVFYSQPGQPAFPIRLASEVFQRCLALRPVNQSSTRCVLYDPCCGAAYQLSVLAYLHWEVIGTVIGSDINAEAVRLAGKNLGLLSAEGLQTRISEISELFQRYGKDSHQLALDSASVLQNRIAALSKTHPLTTKVFQANATDGHTLAKNLEGPVVDIVIADVPYGQHSHWHALATDRETAQPLWLMLNALLGVLTPNSVVAIVSDKGQKVAHADYQRLEHFPMGKRRVVILKPRLMHPAPLHTRRSPTR